VTDDATQPVDATIYPDGSRTWQSRHQPGKWVARTADGGVLHDSTYAVSYFDTQQLAEEALAGMGQGPAAQINKGDRTPDPPPQAVVSCLASLSAAILDSGGSPEAVLRRADKMTLLDFLWRVAAPNNIRFHYEPPPKER
jgi:hypothetical protein